MGEFDWVRVYFWKEEATKLRMVKGTK